MSGRVGFVTRPARPLKLSLMDIAVRGLSAGYLLTAQGVPNSEGFASPTLSATCSTSKYDRQDGFLYSDAQRNPVPRKRNLSSVFGRNFARPTERPKSMSRSSTKMSRQDAFSFSVVPRASATWTRNSSSVFKAVRDVAEAETRMDFKPTSYNFKEYMADLLKSVNTALDEEIAVSHPELITQAMRYTLLSGGKRVCSIICIAACELVGGSRESVLPISCAMEMTMDAHLIHDDLPCVDNAEIRRGKIANHKKFGEGVALYAGDALLARAFEHIAMNTRGVAAEKVLRAIAVFARAAGSEGGAGGQVMDLLNTDDPNVSLENMEDIHLHKTARPAEAAARCGAVLGGGSEEEIERLGRFGRNLGYLFQVVDDILDVAGSEEEMGKATGKDAMLNKATYPKFFGLEGARRVAVDLNRRAKDDLSGFDEQKAAPLRDLADFVLRRGL